MARTRSIAIFGIMAVSAILAQVLRPTEYLADTAPYLPLEKTVPKLFGEWREVESNTQEVIDPTQRIVIEKIYSQTLTRTYVDKDGYMIMLSIAYGKSQRDGVEMHKPEVCYPAQGFLVDRKESSKEHIGDVSRSLNLTRMVARKGFRVEPITYWTLVGETVVSSRYEKKFAEISYAFNNKVPDGMLMRISSIDENIQRAYGIQIKFVKSLYEYMPHEERSRLFGRL